MPESPFALLNRHINVSYETFERLSLYRALLVKWQQKINLISPDSVETSWTRHFLDSLQLIHIMPDKRCAIIDIGSGAGFPGMVLAINGYENTHLVESDAKKIAFLKEVARITNTKVEIFHGRVENLPVKKNDVILSRACSDLNQLLNYSSPFVSHGTDCLFHKGKNYLIELEDAKKEWSFTHQIIQSVTDPQGVILKLSSIQRHKNGE